MPNVINKVVYGSQTLIDLTSDTVDANKMLSGVTAHDKSGAVITGSIQNQNAATYTPTTSNQTIPSGKYLSGVQTILGDANLIAANIKKDVVIFGVTGTHEGGAAGGSYNIVSVDNGDGTQNINITDASGGGDYNIVSVDNGDGTQDIYITDASGGGDITVTSLTVTENDTYTAPSGTAYSPVIVNVPTGTARTSTDLTVSGATVTVPAGLYSAQASASVASGTEGTPIATKGTVSSNSITITPSVTNTAGYISGATKTGTGVTVSASELVSGDKELTAQTGTDVTNNSTASVISASVALNNPTVNSSGLVTASATLNTSGWIGSAPSSKTLQLPIQEGFTISPTLSEQTAVASGKYTTGNVKVAAITSSVLTALDSDFTAGNIKNGVNMFGLVGTYEGSGGGGGMNVQGYHGLAEVAKSSLTASGVKLTVAKTGTYKVSWMGVRNNTSSTWQSQLYINGRAYGTAQSTFTRSYAQSVILTGVSLTAGDTVEVYARSRSTSYYMMVGNLIIEQTA